MTNQQQEIIDRLSAEVRESLQGESSGHDWWHIDRVVRLANRLAAAEGADPFIVSLAALLHDIPDWKFNAGSETAGLATVKQLLEKYHAPETVIPAVLDVVSSVSYKGASVATPMHTKEGAVVQDADRLDAMGAIGIARTFAYGGFAHRPMYDPDKKPELHASKEAYFKSQSPSVNHFYEKLLLLKDRMNTETAKKMAIERHAYMEAFLARFFDEWSGKR